VSREVAVEAQALRDMERRYHATFDLLAAFACPVAGMPVFFAGLVKMSANLSASLASSSASSLGKRLLSLLYLLDDCCAVHYRVITRYPRVFSGACSSMLGLKENDEIYPNHSLP
jgi:hypothetical protein